MESQNPLPPSYIAHFASSGNTGPTGLAYNTPGMMETNWSVQEEESSPIGLNLELGRGSCQKLDNKRFHGFTILQLHELQLQALIFKYIEAGLPVPYHLVLPIWQSFSTTLGSLNNGLLPYFPNSLGAGPVCLDSRKGMDTEPWRCRRTDGKKWRCSKEALPQQKYCERHIHRGRHRSRKLVDSSKYTHNGVSKTTMANTSSGGVIGSNSNMTDLSISLPVSKNSTSIALFSSLG